MKDKIKRHLRDNQLLLMLLMGAGVFFMITGGPDIPFFERGDEVPHAEESEAEARKSIFEIWSKYGESQKASNEGKQEENKALPAEQTEDTVIEDVPMEYVWQTVGDDYFDDALFIGDSRIVGLQDYGKMEDHATFYASTGLNIFKLLSAKIVTLEGQLKKVSVEEALGQKSFGKIYLMVGINELDIGTVERFRNTYQETIERIQELQPNAIIYIQSIMKVTSKRAAKGDFVKNTSIEERNNAIMQLADNERVFYLDVNEAVCDESGGMNPAYTSDGVHLKVKYIPLWRDYLMSHAIVK